MPLQLGPLACEFTPWDRSTLLCEHCGAFAEAPIHSPARRAAVAIRFRWPPICAGLEGADLGLTCDFCRTAPAMCVGAGIDAGEQLAACDTCCGHSGDLDDGGPCVRVAAGATALDWPEVARTAAEVAP